MSANVDLFTIATSGVNASSKLLSTTSNNIANVNSEGYVRERSSVAHQLYGGVGRVTTERIIDQFAQNQLRRDITQVGEWETFANKTAAIDNMLANEANSISTGLSDFFASMQTAADDPTNLATRSLVLSEGESLLRRLTSVSDFMSFKEEELNLEFTSMVNRANNLIETIGDLNKSIMVLKGNSTGDEPTALINERDNAINNLAELMDISVRESKNAAGSLLVNLSSGESLVLEDGSFNLFELTDNADFMQKQLQLSTNFEGSKPNTNIRITEDDLGGSLGGLFRYRDDILGPAQRDIGQLAVSFADAVNQQNRFGMDLDFQLGSDIFTLPELTGLPYTDTPGTLEVAGQFTPGRGTEVTDADIKVTVTAVAAGVPSEVTVEFLNANGTPKLDENNQPVIYSGIGVGAGYTEIPGGIEIDFQSAGGYSVDNEFLFQPTKYTASDISMATSRPEDLAFASPIRAETGLNNLGDASVTDTRVYDTNVAGSFFNGAGGLDSNAPAQIRFTSANDYEVLDAAGGVLATVTGATDYNNLLAQAGGGLDGSYDLSLEGEPVAGDTFTIEYNTDGRFDNKNALALAGLQREALVQLSTNANSTPRTFHESYSTLVSRIGEQAASADIALQAAETMKVQSQDWFDSVSGVSLDEEAANLVRYQQSYAAAARILTTAQDLFNTILSSVR
ncbi:MAG: flagellar hook-associated protein FlgK [Pseudomonadota bacterium]|uniref:Flagellar hook-associated protein 1 n=1 Tax=Alteromonas alba TaxID=2079529 RepID=A0A2S9VEA4_9ALTE|nr:flagellar hook-associated protein FlgK [Alteromonas alba]MDY6928358.1 flagellar hook-associated protein FlgK [Pseudomonadota bacterium]PRO74788.1 flagellar hook-associated protein FlgK [Alteromonas alba]